MLISHRELLTADFSLLPPYIYSQTGLLYDDNNYLLSCQFENAIIYCGFHLTKEDVYLNTWGGDFKSAGCFSTIIKYLFKTFGVRRIRCQYSYFNYYNNLWLDCNFKIDLPVSNDALYSRLSQKARYNKKRERRILLEKGISFVEVKSELFSAAIDCFFSMKMQTHNRDWKLSAEDFLEQYHITNIYALINVRQEYIAVLLSDEQFDTVCFQNTAYDVQYEQYSPGSVMFLYYLEKLIEKRKKCCHLGGGNHAYKKSYGAIKERTYNGVIERYPFLKGVYNYILILGLKCKKYLKGYKKD